VLAAIALVALANRSGVGWSWDSADYVSSARSMADGLGVLDAVGRPTTIRPPGYPALVAIGEVLRLPTGLSLLVVNLVAAATVVLGTRALLTPVVRRGTATLAAWAVAVTPALLWQYSMAWSEPAFVALLVLGVLVAARGRPPAKYPLLVALAAGLFFVRYAGLVFLPVLLAVAVLTDRPRLGWVRALGASAATAVGSLAPVAWWLARNRSIDGRWTGPREPGGGTIGDAAGVMLGTVGRILAASPSDSANPTSWSEHPLGVRTALLIAVAVVVAAATVGVLAGRAAGRWWTLAVTSAIAIIGYVAFSAYRFVNLEYAALDTRMTVPLVPFLVVLVALTLDRATSALPRLRRPLALGAMTLIALHGTAAVGDAREFSSGRHLASDAFRDMPLHVRARALPDLGGLYSNAPQYLMAATGAWPVYDQWRKNDPRPEPCERSYVVWYADFPVRDGEPDQALAIYTDETGSIYDVGPCDADVKTIWD